MIPYGCRPRPRGAEAQRHRGSGLKAQAKGSASYMSADEESIALVVGAWLARQSVVVAAWYGGELPTAKLAQGEPKQRGGRRSQGDIRRTSKLFRFYTQNIFTLFF